MYLSNGTCSVWFLNSYAYIFCFVYVTIEDIKDEMKLNANITKVLSEAKSKFSDDEHEVKIFTIFDKLRTKAEYTPPVQFLYFVINYTCKGLVQSSGLNRPEPGCSLAN